MVCDHNNLSTIPYVASTLHTLHAMEIWTILLYILGTLFSVGVSAVVLLRFRNVLLRRWQHQQHQQHQQQQQQNDNTKIIAFFHPYCAGGGGGERVLWKALEVLGNMVDQYPMQVLVYTIDEPTPNYASTLLAHVQERFSIDLSDKLKIHFAHLDKHKDLLKPSPYLSLIMESLGAMRLAWYGLQQSQRDGKAPHIFVDTTGCAFTFVPAAILFACRVVAYVHYPTISTDMLQMVFERRRAAYNHSADIAQSRIKTIIKLIYYCIFAFCYGLVGSLATLVMVNSSWTFNHICFLWKGPAWRRAIHIVYPPCAVTDLQATKSASRTQASPNKVHVIASIGQFRPEKDHVLQISALRRLLDQHPELRPTTKLKLVGSCRNDDDEARLALLKKMVQELGLATNVEFAVNVPYSTIKTCLEESSVGIHTMWNEHFGIGIVEMMAAGLLVVAHNSGGPRTDIVTPGVTGFLAATADEYAEALHQALTLPTAEAIRMREAAQKSSLRFSDEVFAASFREKLVRAKLFL